jgi:antitoxin component of MazEF toxin-antitoxin module
MSRKKLIDRFKRNLVQVGGNSLSITLPIEYVNALEWKKGTEVLVILDQ